MKRDTSTDKQPSRSQHITVEGYARLQEELASLWIRRREVVNALSAAAAEGDRSENAEYIYRKKQLRELDRRIRYRPDAGADGGRHCSGHRTRHFGSL